MAARKGFTIIEVLATALILSLLCLLGLNTFYRNLDSTTLDGAASHLLNAAQLARLIASENRRPCLLWIDKTQNSFWLEPEAPQPDPFESSSRPDPIESIDNRYDQPQQLPAGVHFEQVRTPEAQSLYSDRVSIRFDSNSTAEPGTIQMSSELDSLTVLIWPATARAELRHAQIEQLPDNRVDLNQTGQTGDMVFRLW